MGLVIGCQKMARQRPLNNFNEAAPAVRFTQMYKIWCAHVSPQDLKKSSWRNMLKPTGSQRFQGIFSHFQAPTLTNSSYSFYLTDFKSYQKLSQQKKGVAVAGLQISMFHHKTGSGLQLTRTIEHAPNMLDKTHVHSNTELQLQRHLLVTGNAFFKSLMRYTQGFGQIHLDRKVLTTW